MKTTGKLALALSAIFWVSAAVAQEDSTTTTTHTDHYDNDHHNGAYVGVPGVVGVHVGGDSHSGCETHSKTVQDNDTGDSRTHTETNC